MDADHNYTYAQGTITGAQSSLAKIKIRRNTTVFRETDDIVVDVDRWRLYGVRLPAVDHLWNDISQIAIRDINSGTVYYGDVSYETPQYLYSYQELADALTLGLSDACSQVGGGLLSADWPEFGYDEETKVFNVLTTSTFRSGFEILVDNTAFVFGLPTFYYPPTTPLSGWSVLYTATDITTQYEASLEYLFPVRRIALRQDGMPVVPEIAPPQADDPTRITDNTRVMLVDYSVDQFTSSSQHTYEYRAGGVSGRRWHNLLSGSVNDITLEFFWIDANDVWHAVNLDNTRARADIKLVFARKRE